MQNLRIDQLQQFKGLSPPFSPTSLAFMFNYTQGASPLKETVDVLSSPRHVSPALGFNEISRLLDLEFGQGVATPLLSGQRKWIGTVVLEAEGKDLTGDVTSEKFSTELHLLTDGLLMKWPNEERPELFLMESIEPTNSDALSLKSPRGQKPDIIHICLDSLVDEFGFATPSEALNSWIRAWRDYKRLPVTPRSISSTLTESDFTKDVLPSELERSRTYLDKKEWNRDAAHRCCQVCEKIRFNAWNRRHHCRTCGKVICANCSRFDIASVRVCITCYV